MVVLGIDPGTARTGFGVVRVDGSSFRALAHGTVATSPDTATGERLARIHAAVAELLDRHAPAYVALETLFVGLNPRTILAVGQARGAVLAACGAAGVPTAEYSPGQVKTAVCGYGRAEKVQVGRMVEAILALREPPASDHAADALAVAICHVSSWQGSALAGRAAR